MKEKQSFDELIVLAEKARNLAYAPYSGFKVGAALLCENGKVYTGCNIENASFSPTVCAERVAFFKAIAEGERDFVAIAIAGGKQDEQLVFCPPCGVCRQVMAEFCDKDFLIVGKDEKYTLEQLLPMGFKL